MSAERNGERNVPLIRADKIEMKPGPSCPDCGRPMPYYGGSAGYVCCGYKQLYRSSGWFRNGVHVADDRLAGGTRRVAGVVHEIRNTDGGRGGVGP